VQQLLGGRPAPLPPHERPLAAARAQPAPAATPSVLVRSCSSPAAGGAWAAAQGRRPGTPPGAGSTALRAQYSMAEHYLGALTPVAERLLLGSAAALTTPARLREAGVTHVLLLFCGPEVRRAALSCMLIAGLR
jgi:hypothetical protein